MAWLEAISAVDLGIFINGRDFAATQEMTEDLRQEVTFMGGFGSDGPILRTVRFADENTVTFSAILLKQGVANHLNDEAFLRTLRDFTILCKRGRRSVAYTGCNWTRISIRSTRDQCVVDVDVSVPGYAAPAG
jgi:hypothetical protein